MNILKKWWFYPLVLLGIIFQFIFWGVIFTPANNETSSVTNEQKSILRNSNGKEFYEILCDIAKSNKKDGTSSNESIEYISYNNKYGIKVVTNKNNEVSYISIYTTLPNKNDYENFFVAISRLTYEGGNRSECFNWIHDNLGKDTSTKIGNANFKLFKGDSGNLTLEVLPD